MRRNGSVYPKSALSIIIFVLPFLSFAQQQPPHKKKRLIKQVYLSWGYNKEWYTNSSLHVSQPSLGNDYTLEHVKAHDHPGWDEAILTKQLSIPQYNYRLGFLLDEKKGWGFEINFDHTKYIMADQDMRIKGTLDNHPVDSTIVFNSANGFYYFLNNGANFLLFNVTKRYHILETRHEKLKLDFYGKIGVGPVIPHTQNSLFGKPNHQGFQFGGWNTGMEGVIRATFFRYVYLEYSNKVDYARYSGVNIYQGKAHQAFGTYEMILSLGFDIPTSWK